METPKDEVLCFKPYYKWNTFNTYTEAYGEWIMNEVLNLIINGIPSIRKENECISLSEFCFKPYYKWNTFNTIL